MSTHRTTIEIDRDICKAAELALGTRGYKDTVDTALRDAVRRAKLKEAANLVRNGSLPFAPVEAVESIRKNRV